MEYDVKNVELAPGGRLRIDWASTEMPVLKGIKRKIPQRPPLCRNACCCLYARHHGNS